LPMRLRVVVLEGHLVAALLGRPAVVVMTATGLRLLRAPTDLQPVPGLGTGVEMRVPPALGRNEYRARSPVDPHGLVASRADEQRVAMAANGGDVDAGAVAMERGMRTRLRAEAQSSVHRAVQHYGAAAGGFFPRLEKAADRFPAIAQLSRRP